MKTIGKRTSGMLACSNGNSLYVLRASEPTAYLFPRFLDSSICERVAEWIDKEIKDNRGEDRRPLKGKL